ncbi:MAG: T9SS type A sorting domain-containing protein [Candidatus Delongbacteria bacterium]|nr:T9SS type A sorting domain-containing protein [Candidatus Delongbacteria bacterium]
MKKFMALVPLLLLLAPAPARADLLVHTFDQLYHSWVNTHIDTFDFPTENLEIATVTLQYTIGCPSGPGDCDPWDRLGHVYIYEPETDSTLVTHELARVITPYDITGGSYPGTCAWELDVTDFQHLLQGQVILGSQIGTYIGEPDGWLVTVDFLFEEGPTSIRSCGVETLWLHNSAWYGNPDQPFSDYVPPVNVTVPADVDSVKLRITTTGHGQGNTYNAAEFSEMLHSLFVGADYFSHILWRDDCNSNPCSPQGGTWQYNRAGWCPGSISEPWEISGFSWQPGGELMVYYFPQAYLNLCRPCEDCFDNPPPNCPDCNYNSTGHTSPYYSTTGQLVFYREVEESVVEATAVVKRFELHRNYPNPFNPVTNISFTLEQPALIALEIFNLQGEVVELLSEGFRAAGTHLVQFDATANSSGIYFCRLQVAENQQTIKIACIK